MIFETVRPFNLTESEFEISKVNDFGLKRYKGQIQTVISFPAATTINI